MPFTIGRFYDFKNKKSREYFKYDLCGIPEEFIKEGPKKLIGIVKGFSDGEKTLYRLTFKNIKHIPMSFRQLEYCEYLEQINIYKQEELDV